MFTALRWKRRKPDDEKLCDSSRLAPSSGYEDTDRPRIARFLAFVDPVGAMMPQVGMCAHTHHHPGAALQHIALKPSTSMPLRTDVFESL